MRHKFLGIGEPGYHPIRKLQTILSGLRYAILFDWSVTYKLVLSGGVLVFAFAYREWIDFLVVALATAMVLTAEILNSAIEALCDFVEDRHNEKIKVIKDMSAAGVGISMFVWIIVLAVEVSQIP